MTLAGVVAVGVTVLYLLKLRKRRIQVPFSHLWSRVLANKRTQTSFWRRFRRILSWLLHIIMVALLAFALADPHPSDEAVKGRHLLLLIDNSASMAATDVSGGADRMDLARQKAAEILDSVGPEDRVMLAAFNEHIQPLSPFVAQASLLEKPLQEIEAVATGTSYDDALSFAADSLRGTTDAQLVLISDGAGLREATLDKFDFGENTIIRHLKVGESGGNIGVTAFNVRRYLSNKLDYELFVQVRNYFDRSVEAELEIYADGRLVDTKPIRLEANETKQDFYPSQAVAGERLEARVRLTSRDARDHFPMDNRAFAMLPKTQKASVLLVSDGNLFLEGPLMLNLNIKLKKVATSAYAPKMSGQYDVTLFDRFAPPKDLLPEAGNFVFFNPPAENSPWEVSGVIEDPIITTTQKSHPLMRWITLKDLNITEAAQWRTGRWDSVVASSFGKPIVVTRAEVDQKMVGIAFDIQKSDLPLRVALPVLMINIIDYFTLDDASYIPNYTTGETWAVDLGIDVEKATVTRPSGEQIEVPAFNKRALFQGDEIGFYTITASTSGENPTKVRQTIAGNLSNPEESRITPTDLELGDKEVEQGVDNLIFERNELWIWAILALLALLLLEWFSYNRRITV